MEVEFGKNSDIDEWMKLVEEISWNFPGLETKERIDEHRETVMRFITKGHALGVKNDKRIIGVLLFSRGQISRTVEFGREPSRSALVTKSLLRVGISKN